MKSIHCLLLMAILSWAPMAQAYSVSLVQAGGTAAGGVGQLGDTVIVDVVVDLLAGDAITVLFTTLSWDLEGGDVLELVSVTEPVVNVVNGVSVSPFGTFARLGDPTGNPIDSILFDTTNALYPTLAGPSFIYGIEGNPPAGIRHGDRRRSPSALRPSSSMN